MLYPPVDLMVNWNLLDFMIVDLYKVTVIKLRAWVRIAYESLGIFKYIQSKNFENFLQWKRAIVLVLWWNYYSCTEND